ncbi:MAG: MFS transporter [Deltaproteobacteria bacterium]|nr:MFS transporter [Deltaproteobacteria bacterium]
MSTTTRGNDPSSLTAAQWWLLAAVGLSSLMVASQTSALNAILPFVARSFGVDLPTIQWVVLAYLIVSSGLLLAFGRLGDMIGQRRLFLIGFAIFIGGSLLSALASSLAWLIVTRIIQAVGGGMITSSGSPLITKTLPQSHRGRGLSAQIVMVYFGLAAGPGLGGILADTLGWHWVFLVNVPLGLLAAAVTLAAVPRDEIIVAKQPFDWVGALTFMVALTSLFFLMGSGKGRQWLPGGDAILSVVFLFAAVAFVVVELRRQEPMLDLRLFKSRFFSAATSSALINYIGYSALAFMVPFYLVDGIGYGATSAGVLIMAMPVGMMISAPFSGWFADKVGPWIPASLGMVLLAGGIFIFSRLGAAPSQSEIVARLMLAGAGLGLFSSANNSAIMGEVPINRQGVANGVVSTARQLGMMLGVAATTAIFKARYPLYSALGEARATMSAVEDALLVVSGIILLGALTSLVRGKEEAQSEPVS